VAGCLGAARVSRVLETLLRPDAQPLEQGTPAFFRISGLRFSDLDIGAAAGSCTLMVAVRQDLRGGRHSAIKLQPRK